MAQTFAENGYDTTLTTGGGDHGVDAIAESRNEKVVIQSKRYALDNPVGSSTVRNIAGARQQFDADRAVLATSSSFTDPAIEAAEGADVDLVNGDQLYRLYEKKRTSISQ